ncbi:MAG: thymidine phosphorylase [Actinomycetota bacterium]
MNIDDITDKKINGEALTAKEIAWVVLGYTKDIISEEKMTAWLKAVFAKGMDFNETLAMTHAFVASGETVDLSGIDGFKVDKHSTGGVGDKTTLVVAPLAAACGLKVAKMSGRSLGHTGGTLDRLEAIPGLSVELTRERFIDQINEIGVAITGQSETLAPADKKIYALRDKTKTVASLPLIASSVMSKKIAAGADYIVLDVKAGSGAFMKSTEDARALAELCVKLGAAAGRGVSALITDMSQPLGRAVTGILEVREAIQTLNGRGPADLSKLSHEIVSMMLIKAGYADNKEEASAQIDEAIASGKATAKLAEMVQAQGGDPAMIKEPARLPSPVIFEGVAARENGFVRSMDTEHIGWLAKRSQGLMLEKKIGDEVKKGEQIAYAFSDSQVGAEATAQGLSLFIEIGPERLEPRSLILETVNAPA